MNLTKKLKPLAAGLMLSAASLGVVSGCATTTPWERVRTESRDTGIERTEKRDAGNRTIKKRYFEISDSYIEGDAYKTNITESLKDVICSVEGTRTVKTFDEIVIEERKNESKKAGMGVLLGIGGFFVGAGIEKMIDDARGEDNNLLRVLAGAAGAATGITIGTSFPAKRETRENKIGTREKSSEEKFFIDLVREEAVYSNQGKKVEFGVVGKEAVYQTDAAGVIHWLKSKPYVFVSREGLEKKLEEIPLVKEIKPETRERLRERLLEAISSYNEQVTIETRESPADDLEVIKNATKTLNFDYYTLKEEDIYNVVRQFVDGEINPSIKTLKFNVREDLTHVPISGSNFEFTTDSPSKADLLDKYFEGTLKIRAENFILDYLHGSLLLRDCPERMELPVYSPSNIFLEVTHPEYNFVDGEIGIDGDMEKTVYMTDKGSKVRLQNAEENIGRIE